MRNRTLNKRRTVALLWLLSLFFVIGISPHLMAQKSNAVPNTFTPLVNLTGSGGAGSGDFGDLDVNTSFLGFGNTGRVIDDDLGNK
ncbi:MAG: hypothetical protein E6Q95_00580 [Chitinophagaceae bacterium]|nr:MAG: hypothetical protein E6Q95_00580 [Chitinophagaceae bacterium]